MATREFVQKTCGMCAYYQPIHAHQGKCQAGQIAAGGSGLFWDSDPRIECRDFEKVAPSRHRSYW